MSRTTSQVPEDISGQNPSTTVVKGMVLMCAAMLALPAMDGMAKLLQVNYDVTAGQVTFGRFVTQATLFVPIICLLAGPKNLLPKKIGMNLLRGAVMSVAVLIFFVTLRYMPIADAIAVFFLEPLILTVLSVVVLKETVGWRRGLAVIVGFIGAMFVIQPSYEIFGPVSLMPMATALLFAIYLIMTRRMSGDSNSMAMQFISGVGGCITLGIILVFGTYWGIENIASPGVPEFGIRWLLIFAIGALATVGHLAIVVAFRLASASLLAPFQYLEIIGATAFGYWLFGEFPDGWRWLGIAIIVASGIYVFHRGRMALEA